MGDRQIADRYLLQACVGAGHRDDRPRARHDQSHALAVDDLERINRDGQIGGHGRESLPDETRPFGGRERGDSPHGEEHGAVQFDRGGRDFTFARRTHGVLCAQRIRRDQSNQQQRQHGAMTGRHGIPHRRKRTRPVVNS